VAYVVLRAVSLHSATPIHCTPLPLHPPLLNTQALSKDGTMAKWDATAWAKKVRAKKTRAGMTDFDRFKLMVAKKKRSQAVKKTLKPKKK